jgi:hypothetical protein
MLLLSVNTTRELTRAASSKMTAIPRPFLVSQKEMPLEKIDFKTVLMKFVMSNGVALLR